MISCAPTFTEVFAQMPNGLEARSRIRGPRSPRGDESHVFTRLGTTSKAVVFEAEPEPRYVALTWNPFPFRSIVQLLVATALLGETGCGFVTVCENAGNHPG